MVQCALIKDDGLGAQPASKTYFSNVEKPRPERDGKRAGSASMEVVALVDADLVIETGGYLNVGGTAETPIWLS